MQKLREISGIAETPQLRNVETSEQSCVGIFWNFPGLRKGPRDNKLCQVAEHIVPFYEKTAKCCGSLHPQNNARKRTTTQRVFPFLLGISTFSAAIV